MTTIRRGVELAAREAVAVRTRSLLLAAGAIRRDHAVVADGRHATTSADPQRIVADPALVSELCGYLAAWHRARDGRPTVAAVAGPGVVGGIVAFEVARQLGCRAVLLAGAPGLAAGSRILLVDAVLPSRAILAPAVAAAERTGAEIVECSVLVDETTGAAAVASALSGRSYPLRSLWLAPHETFTPGMDTCPACAEGIPLRGAARGRC